MRHFLSASNVRPRTHTQNKKAHAETCAILIQSVLYNLVGFANKNKFADMLIFLFHKTNIILIFDLIFKIEISFLFKILLRVYELTI